ncbi:MAG: alpha-L-arabinofuranosidase C-terminal domain-containing protein [Pirellulales bacterium]
MKLPSTALVGIGLLALASIASAQTATITIDASKQGPRIDPRLYGIFLEEINHGVDGGLYAELIANRAFEDSRPPEGFTLQNGRWKDAKGYDSGFNVRPGEVPRWSLVRQGAANGEIRVETEGGLNDRTPYCLRMRIEDLGSGRLGAANEGYWGIGLKAGEKYNLVLHARAAGGGGPLTVRLEDGTGNACSDAARLDGIAEKWGRYSAVLTASRSESKARLVVTAGSPGTVWLDFVSLIPQRTWKGHGLRPDIAEMIAGLKPGFVRFPGGCVVEGGTVETAYNWKLTVGPVEERREQWSAWSVRRTHGIGFHEYLQLCEDLGAAPLHVGFAGQSCLFRELENVPMSEMDWVATNFLDAIQYANGAADTPWGAMRAKAGHPAPFGLGLVEIGNENGTAAFPPRYRFVHERLKAKYPEVRYVADLSWIGREAMKDCAFDLEDNHFYNAPQWFMANADMYAQRDRKLPPVYVGEVAVTSGEGGDLKGNLVAALAEGAFLMGCERNADVVKMVSYAPLLAHVDGRSGWHGMIYHDSTRVFGTASYYLWKLFGQHRPDYTVRTEVDYKPAAAPAIAGRIGVGTWDTSAEFKDLRVEKDGKTLYAADFSGDAGWTNDGGRWSAVGGAWRQSDRAVAVSYFGDETWSDYTLTLKARKLSGAEGFLVLFGRKGGDQYWWNLGGWGNREHGLELNRMPVGRREAGAIQANRWYDVKIELRGNRMRCWLDGKLVHEATAPSMDRLFATAGRDDKTGEIVLKVINASAERVRAAIAIDGAGKVAADGQLTVLTSARLDDNNSFDQPTRVAPTSRPLSGAGEKFSHEFPPHSLSILRLKRR